MDAASSTSAAGSSSVYVPQPVVYDGGGTAASTRSGWDGTRNGVAEYVSLSESNALCSFTRLLNFLSMSGIPILEVDDISHHSPQNREIKRGASMQVFAGDYNGKAVALKYFRLSRLDSEQQYRESMYDLLFELKVMTHEPLCRHRNIVRALGITFDPEIVTVDERSSPDLINPVVVVELADPVHPDLAELFKAAPHAILTFEVLTGLVADVADGIAILHEYGLTHSDIKPENILIFTDEEGRLTAKIGDFGAAGLDATKDKSRGATWYWAAPESLESCPLPALRETRFGKPHDVYAFGLTAGFIMLLGKRPLPDPDPSGLGASDIKYKDIADEVVYAAIGSLWNQRSDAADPAVSEMHCKLETIRTTLEQTLRLFPNDRITSLDGIRGHLTGSDPYAGERLKHKFTKRSFVERDSSLVGNVLGRNTYDAIEVSPKYSVYPNLPEFLYPLLQKAGLVGSQSTKYYPRSLLGDQPLITLAEMEDNDYDMSMSLAAQHREDLENRWSALEALKSETGVDEETKREGLEAYAAECEQWHQVSGFQGTVQEFANMFAKMQLFPHLYGGIQSYPVLLRRKSETADPALFRIKDPRCGYKTFLHAVCATRDLQTAQFILNHGADINATDGHGLTALMQTFLKPFVFFRSAPGDPIMEKASEIPTEMTIRVAQFLISQGATLDFEPKGVPLIAILETMHFNANKPKLIDFLIQHGHPVDSFHPEFGTPLFCAAVNGNVESTRRLLRLGANPNVKLPKLQRVLETSETLHGPHTLLEAVARDCANMRTDTARLEIFELLLKHGAVVTPRQGQIGWSDASPMAHVFLLKERVDMLRILLKYQPGFILSTNAGLHTPLHVAAWARNLEAVQLLLDHGADADARSMDGTTPPMAAFAYNKGMFNEDADGDRTVEPPELLEKSVEIGHVLGAYGADIAARRSWPFATPTRVYLECDGPEDHSRGVPLTFTDDAFVINWRMWAIRRNLDTDVATCLGALFLKPSIISEASAPFEMILPVLGHNQTRPRSGIYYFSMRFGVLGVENSDMGLLFMLHSGRPGEESESKPLPIGYLDTSSFRRNHAYEIKFKPPILIERSSLYMVHVFLSARRQPTGTKVASGLFLDWVELSPLPPDDDGVGNTPTQQPSADHKPEPPRYVIERMVNVEDKIPRGIWKVLAEEPVDRTENGISGLREFRPLRMEDMLVSQGENAIKRE